MSVHTKLKTPGRTERARVLMIGALITPAGTHKVTIRDVSRTGAHVLIKDELPSGCDVLLKRGALFAAAQVVWVRDNEAGLRFYRELSPDEIGGTLPNTLLR
jgi:hypothetical protein